MSGLIVPVAGKCIGDGWFRGSGPCPEVLKVWATYTYSGCGPPACQFVATDFATRGKTGFACGGSDIYVADQGDGSQRVDVWAAYRAGVWTSSTTIKVYLAAYCAIVSTGVINGEPLSNAAARVTKSGAFLSGTPSGCDAPSGWICPTLLAATITVNDDGTMSIA